MYNKIVATLALLVMVSLLSGAVHAQYYTRTYSSAFGSANGYLLDSSANVNYYGQWQGPSFAPVRRTPSNFNFAYAQNPIRAPVFQPVQYSPSSFNYQFQQTHFQPTYGAGGNFLGDVNVNLAPHFTPNFGPGLGLGGVALNLAPRQIPMGNSLGFGSLNYNFYSQPIFPIYETPSRALFNTEFHYQSFPGYWD